MTKDEYLERVNKKIAMLQAPPQGQQQTAPPQGGQVPTGSPAGTPAQPTIISRGLGQGLPEGTTSTMISSGYERRRPEYENEDEARRAKAYRFGLAGNFGEGGDYGKLADLNEGRMKERQRQHENDRDAAVHSGEFDISMDADNMNEAAQRDMTIRQAEEARRGKVVDDLDANARVLLNASANPPEGVPQYLDDGSENPEYFRYGIGEDNKGVVLAALAKHTGQDPIQVAVQHMDTEKQTKYIAQLKEFSKTSTYGQQAMAQLNGGDLVGSIKLAAYAILADKLHGQPAEVQKQMVDAKAMELAGQMADKNKLSNTIDGLFTREQASTYRGR